VRKASHILTSLKFQITGIDLSVMTHGEIKTARLGRGKIQLNLRANVNVSKSPKHIIKRRELVANILMDFITQISLNGPMIIDYSWKILH
jgi:hypothetical protein